jgi:hypothetical protein
MPFVIHRKRKKRDPMRVAHVIRMSPGVVLTIRFKFFDAAKRNICHGVMDAS